MPCGRAALCAARLVSHGRRGRAALLVKPTAGSCCFCHMLAAPSLDLEPTPHRPQPPIPNPLLNPHPQVINLEESIAITQNFVSPRGVDAVLAFLRTGTTVPGLVSGCEHRWAMGAAAVAGQACWAPRPCPAHPTSAVECPNPQPPLCLDAGELPRAMPPTTPGRASTAASWRRWRSTAPRCWRRLSGERLRGASARSAMASWGACSGRRRQSSPLGSGSSSKRERCRGTLTNRRMAQRLRLRLQQRSRPSRLGLPSDMNR
jgi:hypothetical protein